jgi:hypothetical protein
VRRSSLIPFDETEAERKKNEKRKSLVSNTEGGPN